MGRLMEASRSQRGLGQLLPAETTHEGTSQAWIGMGQGSDMQTLAASLAGGAALPLAGTLVCVWSSPFHLQLPPSLLGWGHSLVGQAQEAAPQGPSPSGSAY